MQTLGRSGLDEKAGARGAWDRKGVSYGWTGRRAEICARKWLSQVWKLDAGARVRGWMRRRALGNVLVFLLAVLAQSGSGVQWGGSLSWLAASLLTFLLFFALGILCCVLTGWIPAVLVAFGGLNCVALLARLLINALCSIFYPSYNDNIFYMGLNDTATWLTPVLRLKMSCSEVALYKESDNFMSPDAWKTLLVYGLVAVALLVGSYFLYRIRRSERSGDTLAFKPLQPVVRWVVALLGGAGLGLVFAELFSGTRELPVLLLSRMLAEFGVTLL